jgi:hypothetical protein
MKRRVIIVVWLFTGALRAPSMAGEQPYDPPHITDNYDIMFGTDQEACLGDPAFLVPINISVSRPTVRVGLIITYDATVVTPTLLAPNIFLQSFTYDLSQAGRIRVTMVTDLPPPPYVPPIYGDTTVAWISFRITTRDMQWDILTHFNFYEDPTIPGPDNFIVLNDNSRIVPPSLVLHTGDLLLNHPLYGDINLNAYPFDIADAVLFLNYFIGRAHLTQCQLANSDCNRDGLQGTIADLVYLLNVINYDSTMLSEQPDMPIAENIWLPPRSATKDRSVPPYDRSFDFMLDGDTPLGGASFLIDLPDSLNLPDAIVLDSAAQYMQMYCSIEGGFLRVTILNWDRLNDSFRGGRLFSIKYPDFYSEVPFKVESADFSDNQGKTIVVHYDIRGAEQQGELDLDRPILALSGHPNPFNGAVSIGFDLPSEGRYRLEIYDILGRKVKTLMDGHGRAGAGEVVWDGRDEAGNEISSGTYFVRLQGSEKSHTLKLLYTK